MDTCIAQMKEEYLAMKKKLELTEQRVTATKKREIRRACDCLSVVQYGLEQNVTERKTSLTEMNNYLDFIKEIIEVLKSADIFTDPME